MGSQAANWRTTAQPLSGPSPPPNVARRNVMLSACTIPDGLVAMFCQQNIPTHSILWSHPMYSNHGADEHPVIIIRKSSDGEVATCVMGTSLRSTRIQDKHQGLALEQYMAVDHNQTVAHNRLPILHLAGGRKMDKQTYVRLEPFKIEARYLEEWRDGCCELTKWSIRSCNHNSALAASSRRFKPGNTPGHIVRLNECLPKGGTLTKPGNESPAESEAQPGSHCCGALSNSTKNLTNNLINNLISSFH
ncbi:hypothetical protein BAUCODRAFT_575543 [Baudoinia panamericana UAMH 10762]|uniref:Uncharacterized protein n=1 Tax=Baudoinia panamericana (strain UAMH 10762) TaxID=717646 RepID=M2MLN1_BAUPA|nr:uncharacterized protein BAUCODRAFT_575543 [Baudoinia panamericana UAMH 10762]EMC97556.1 hypothetical protein BAUCODRAFT_575543 [Baudoinia panamericana UAMH 10762]